MKIKIKGITCEHCVNTVKRLFLQINGVKEVKVDLKSGLADVKTSFPVPKEDFAKVLEDTAYEVINVEE